MLKTMRVIVDRNNFAASWLDGTLCEPVRERLFVPLLIRLPQTEQPMEVDHAERTYGGSSAQSGHHF
jgi:hypothetical protein